MSYKIEIPLSKRKAVMALIGAGFFVIFGCLGAIKPDDFVSPLFRDTTAIQFISIMAVVFFGISMIFITKKLFDNRMGLIIDQNGITDNTNATSIGLIAWDDITGIEVRQVMSTKFLILHTNNPEKYIKRAKSFVSRRAMKMNAKIYGSPLSIISNSLKIRFDELEPLIKKEFGRNNNQIGREWNRDNTASPIP